MAARVVRSAPRQVTSLLPSAVPSVSKPLALGPYLALSKSSWAALPAQKRHLQLRSSSALKPVTASGVQRRGYAEKIVKTPPMADSITEGTLSKWLKQVGEFVAKDEPIATIETDKVDITINSPDDGVLLELFANEGDTVQVGGNLFKIDPDAKAGTAAPAPAKPASPEPAAPAPPTPATTPAAAPAPPAPAAAPPKAAPPPPTPSPSATPATAPSGDRSERRVKMNRMRLRIAERLKESQNTAASLTTFNEVDMSNIIEFRNKYKAYVEKDFNVRLGFMSPFVKATCAALKAVPEVNAAIEGTEIVYRDYVDVSVAVATPKGLVTPVVRNAEKMNLVQIEQAIAALGKKARDNQITIEDLSGGTFTISNGGVYGSLYGTPIINAPQAAILGMHATKDRAVVVNGKVEVRPMMYLALTYDHRIIDGREAVTFLVKIKEYIEDPRKLLLDA
ncbi:dihydrolipoamide succinyltransferase [Gonapodya prolifera JEL478]|uniref:dihydrolipoyllysine-residue succinyltransferase n=1 Tax=Gonapodya prolifera (strain JEL478) TaxID=1344416 RepID=A0A139ASM0_GONPJ|nr:dihydrolipoamide succinyltransferase [Gonapodya prolifera JEL478]|eukprot:KXS19737.1 dihydrolipoamide succinyltransferase [Gonapodya prolifera JEL478]